jgi:hypothetical protein
MSIKSELLYSTIADGRRLNSPRRLNQHSSGSDLYPEQSLRNALLMEKAEDGLRREFFGVNPGGGLSR